MLTFALLALSPGSPVAAQEMRAHELSLGVSTRGAVAAWHGGPGEGSSIYVQALNASGIEEGRPIAVSEGVDLAYEPDLILVGDRPAVAWYQKQPDTGVLSAWLAGLDPEGHRQWIMPLLADGQASRNPVVRLVGDELVVAWIAQPVLRGAENDATIWLARFSIDGRQIGTPRQIGRANRDTWNLNATVHGGDVIITYDAALTSKAHELHMLVVKENQVVHRMLSGDDGHASLYPDLQVNAYGQAALTWFDERDGNQEVYLTMAPFSAFAEGKAGPPMRITTNDGQSIGAYVAWNGSVAGLAWSDEIGGERDIFFQDFNDTGQALGPARQISAGPETSAVPAIRASGAGFLIAWNDYVMEGEGAHRNVTSSRERFKWIPINADRHSKAK